MTEAPSFLDVSVAGEKPSLKRRTVATKCLVCDAAIPAAPLKGGVRGITRCRSCGHYNTMVVEVVNETEPDKGYFYWAGCGKGKSTVRSIQITVDVKEVVPLGKGYQVWVYVGDYTACIYMTAEEAWGNGLIDEEGKPK